MLIAIVLALFLLPALWVAFSDYVIVVILPRYAIPRALLRDWRYRARRVPWGSGGRLAHLVPFNYRGPYEAWDAAMAAAMRSSNPDVWSAGLYFALSSAGARDRSIEAALDLAERTDKETALLVCDGIAGQGWGSEGLWQKHGQHLDRMLAHYDDDPELVFRCAHFWEMVEAQSQWPRLAEALRRAAWTGIDPHTVNALSVLIRSDPGRMPYDAAVAVGAVPPDPAAPDPTWQSVPTALRAILECQQREYYPWGLIEHRWYNAATADTRAGELLFLALTRGQQGASERDDMIECIEFLDGRQRDLFFDLLGEWCLGEGLREENQEQAQRVLAWCLEHCGHNEWRPYLLLQSVRHDARWRGVPVLIPMERDPEGRLGPKVGDWLDWGVPYYSGMAVSRWDDDELCRPPILQSAGM